jgi:hypothetical protein
VPAVAGKVTIGADQIVDVADDHRSISCRALAGS